MSTGVARLSKVKDRGMEPEKGGILPADKSIQDQIPDSRHDVERSEEGARVSLPNDVPSPTEQAKAGSNSKELAFLTISRKKVRKQKTDPEPRAEELEVSSIASPPRNLSRQAYLQEIKNFIRISTADDVREIYQAALDRKKELRDAGNSIPMGKVSYSKRTLRGEDYWVVQWREGRAVRAKPVGKKLPPYDALTCLRKILNKEPLFT